LHDDHRATDLLPFRKDLSFFATDTDRLALDDPQLSAGVARAVGEATIAGHYKRVPVVKVKKATKLVKSGQHMARCVVPFRSPPNLPLPHILSCFPHVVCRSCWSTRTRRAASTSSPSSSF
jgi:hypothetical protein